MFANSLVRLVVVVVIRCVIRVVLGGVRPYRVRADLGRRRRGARRAVKVVMGAGHRPRPFARRVVQIQIQRGRRRCSRRRSSRSSRRRRR